jgi:predicted XRE-type DNA-binding protein
MRTKGDVFDAIFPPERAIVVKFKADLYEAILKVTEQYTPRQLELILHEPQPRVSELLNGKLGQKSLEKLLVYARRLGIEHRGSFTQVHKNVPKKELAVAQA